MKRLLCFFINHDHEWESKWDRESGHVTVSSWWRCRRCGHVSKPLVETL